MSRVDYMDKASECIEAIFQTYVTSRATCGVFLFFEGRDDFVYYSKILLPELKGKSYKKFNCDGKENVHDVHDMIFGQSPRKKEEHLLFFTDRDFDEEEYHDGDDIYITPTYAIENFYFSDEAIKNTISGLLAISDQDENDSNDFEKAVEFIIDKRREVIESMIFANAWYSIQRKKSIHLSSNLKPSLYKIKEYKSIKNINKIDKLKLMVDNSIQTSETEVEKEIERLMQAPDKLLRGKYFEQAMVEPYNKIIEESNKKTQCFFSKKRKITVNLCEDNLISSFAQYADVPNNLQDYIDLKLKLHS